MAADLKKAFLTNSLSRFAFRHADKLASWGLTVGNIGLIAKAGLHPDMDTAAGLFFLANSLIASQTKKRPVLAFRLMGAVCVAGSLCMSATGIDFAHGEIINGWKVAAPLISFVPYGILMGFQHEIATLAQKFSNAKGGLKRAFAKVSQYPVAIGAGLDIPGYACLIKAALVGNDLPMLALIASWAVGEVGLIAADPRLQKLHADQSAQNAKMKL